MNRKRKRNQDNQEYFVETILEFDKVLKQFKIKWEGFGTPTWEPFSNIPKILSDKFFAESDTQGDAGMDDGQTEDGKNKKTEKKKN
jgi:hypothetical protein